MLGHAPGTAAAPAAWLLALVALLLPAAGGPAVPLQPPAALPAAARPPGGFVGVNTATWDSRLGDPRVAALLRAAGVTRLRYPGGSTSDDYDWTRDTGRSNTVGFARLCRATGARATVTVNYGSGTPQMAAAWVAYCNAAPSSRVLIGRDAAGRDWKTAGYWAALRAARPRAGDDGLNALRADSPHPFSFGDWEIGNECYGPWEHDDHAPRQDAVVYARFAREAGRLMRRVDPAVRIGVVVTEADHPYTCQESVYDPARGAQTSEWTPVLLTALATHGFLPDFASFHHYAQDSGHESDESLFHDARDWPTIARRLREQMVTYLGLPGLRVALDCTECNSVATNPGPQTTGEANARYYAQVAPEALRLGVESFIWWDLNNGRNRNGYDDHSPLNRYPYGDYGILDTEADEKPYPVYYALRRFATGR